MLKSLLALGLLAVAVSVKAQVTFDNWSHKFAPGSHTGGLAPVHRTYRPPEMDARLLEDARRNEPQALVWDGTIGATRNSPDGGIVWAMASEGDDLYLAGDFYGFDSITDVANIVHYNRATGRWNALNYGAYNEVRALALHNGKLYVGGYFQHVGDPEITVNNIAVWDGTAWSDLGGGMDAAVLSLAFVGDDLYAGGNFTQAGSTTAYFLAKWDGSSWEQVGGGTSYPVITLYATHDSLFVGGDFTWVGGQRQSTGIVADGIALWQNDNWTTYGNAFSGPVQAITMHEGRLWIGGAIYYSRDLTRAINGLASWDGNDWVSEPADSFAGEISALASDGTHLYATGMFSNAAGIPSHSMIVRTNGQWSEVGNGLRGYGLALGLFNGKVYVGGNFDRAGTIAANGIAIYDPVSTDWSTVGAGAFDGWGAKLIDCIATSGTKVYVGGRFRSMAGVSANHIAVYDRVTRHWSALGNGVDGNVFSICALGDKVYVGGWFHHADSVETRNIAVWNNTTNAWSSVATKPRASVSAIETDGQNIYASVERQGTPDGYIAHVSKWDGTTWTELPGDILGYIDVLRWNHGRLYAGGTIEKIDGEDYGNIALFDGNNWEALGAGFDNNCYDIAIEGSDVYAVGEFVTADAVNVSGIARWDGATWNALGSGLNAPAYGVQADGKGDIYVTGYFTLADDANVSALAKWDGASFSDVAGGLNNGGLALASDPTALYVAGWFTDVGTNFSTVSRHIAQLRGAGSGVWQPLQGEFALAVLDNPTTNSLGANLSVERPQLVAVVVTDMLGRVRASLPAKIYTTGQHTLRWDSTSWPAGTYAIRASTSDGRSVTSLATIVK